MKQGIFEITENTALTDSVFRLRLGVMYLPLPHRANL